mmetsp:Transcript_90147/g.291367  ORF Transcript_90147/g.291367 Transcript_90147/m.291367 type:complete len:559 (-) Transcript_90147:43-1719(-)
MRPTSAKSVVSTGGGGSHSDAVAAAGLKQWFALRQTTAGDATEEASLTKAILSDIYQRRFEDAEALSVLPSCAEVGWLVECQCRAPLPTGWRKSKVAAGDVPDYYCESTGETLETPPSFRQFVRLAELAIRVRLDPAHAAKAVQGVRNMVVEMQRTVADIDRKWTGPHADPTSGEEYYHNPRTGESVWDPPSSWASYIVMVGERLLHAEAFVLHGASAARLEAAEARAASAEFAAEVAKPGLVASSEAALASDGPLPWESGPDAWGALDALMELGGDAEQTAPCDGDATRWAEMEKWISTQPKQNASAASSVGAVPPLKPAAVAAAPAPAKEATTGGYPQSSGSTVARAPDPRKLPPKPKLPAVPTALPAVPFGKIAPKPSAAPAPPAPKPAGKPAPLAETSTAPAPAPAPATAPSAAAAAAVDAIPPAASSSTAMPPPLAPPPTPAAVHTPAPEPAPPSAPGLAPSTAAPSGDLASLTRELVALAPDGGMAGPEDCARVRELLEAIEKQPASFDILRDTKLGIITKPYKDSPDPQIKAVASRLRKAWKEMLAPKQKG